MKSNQSRIGDSKLAFNSSVSAFMEQTNLFSLTYKRKMCENVKVVPLYLKNIRNFQYFYDSFVENHSIAKDEYISFCDDLMNLFSNIETTSLRSKKLCILKKCNKVGVVSIILSVFLFSLMVSYTSNRFSKLITFTLTSLFVLYFIFVTGFCIFYLIRVFRTHRFSATYIKALNIYIFKLNIKYRPKGIEFRFQTSTKELVIRKIL